MNMFALRSIRRSRLDRVVLDRIDLDIPIQKITAIVGPSGSGKTSLLRLLNRLDEPDSGTITIQDRSIRDIPIRSLRQRVGFMSQTAVMFPGTVSDNLSIAAALAKQPADINTSLQDVGLDSTFAQRTATELSGGEQQRVSLARTLATAPDALLLDEPTASLDPEAAKRLLSTVQRLCEIRKMTIVMVTHRLSEARAISNWTVMLDGGQVVEVGETQSLFGHANSERARAYLNSEQ